jgi:hypothetical protein
VAQLDGSRLALRTPRWPRCTGTARGVKEDMERHIESISNTHQRHHGQIEHPGFDFLQVLQVKRAALRSLLQRPTSLVSKPADIGAEALKLRSVSRRLFEGLRCTLVGAAAARAHATRWS